MELSVLLDAAWSVRDRAAAPRAVLGLAGAPASGKSTLARALVAGLNERHGPDSAAYVPMDGFHLSDPQLERLGLLSRKGSPPTFDVRGYAALLARVAGDREHDVYWPDYDRVVDAPVAARHVVRPTAGLAVTEGNYLACELPGWTGARQHIDVLWYVDAPDDVRTQRLLVRARAGGRGAAEAQEWVHRNDMPNGEVVRASRENACVSRVVSFPVTHANGFPA